MSELAWMNQHPALRIGMGMAIEAVMKHVVSIKVDITLWSTHLTNLMPPSLKSIPGWLSATFTEINELST